MTAIAIAALTGAVVVAALGLYAVHLGERWLRRAADDIDRAQALVADCATTADSAGMDALLADRLRERFVLTLTTGETFGGLLEQVDERTVVLRNASSIGTDGSEIPADGELLLRRESIAYMQRP